MAYKLERQVGSEEIQEEEGAQDAKVAPLAQLNTANRWGGEKKKREREEQTDKGQCAELCLSFFLIFFLKKPLVALVVKAMLAFSTSSTYS